MALGAPNFSGGLYGSNVKPVNGLPSNFDARPLPGGERTSFGHSAGGTTFLG